MHESIGIVMVILLTVVLCALWVKQAIDHRAVMLENPNRN